MKGIKFFLLKTYLRLGLFFYLRRITFNGLNNIPADKPTLILCNHQNALIDPLLLAVNLPKYGHFLTRASVFKKPSIGRFLKSINMIPVYRIRDGWHNLSNNKTIFQECVNILSENGIVVLFPEGSHSLVRRVRPLSKGFTRIVFEFLEKHPDRQIQLVPVGLNFRTATEFVDQVHVNIGRPISYQSASTMSKHQKVLDLKAAIHQAITELTTHIPEDDYNEILTALKDKNVDFLNAAEVNQCIQSGLSDCVSRPKRGFDLIKPALKILSKVMLFLPYGIWRLFIKPKIEEPEFISTFRFAVAITLVPLYLLALVLIIGLIFGWSIAFLSFGLFIFISLLTVKL